MARYNTVETTKVSGKCFDFVYSAAIENGTLLAKGALATGQNNVYTATLPTAKSEVFLTADPAWTYDDSKADMKNEEAYIIPSGKIFRVYGLLDINHDKFGVMDYGMIKNGSANIAIGDYVVADTATGKVKDVGTTEPDGTAVGFYGKVTEIDSYGFPWVVGDGGTVVDGQPGVIDTRCNRIIIEVIQNKNV